MSEMTLADLTPGESGMVVGIEGRADKFLIYPLCPVAQKLHFTGQPTCDETQSVFLISLFLESLCLKRTVSIVPPSSNSNKNFSVLSIFET